MKLSEFNYYLPESLIAQIPLSPRDSSRMMLIPLDGSPISHHRFRELPDFLREGDVLVFNRSRVIPARILFDYRERECELFFLRELPDRLWEVMMKPGSFFRKGCVFQLSPEMSIEVVDVRPARERGHRLVRVHDSLERDSFQILDAIGTVPLPPYIRSPVGRQAYQTIYARDPGSVAAPTAGFHFTDELLRRLKEKGVSLEFVTLHVGAGTFLPVTSERVEDHVMHGEYFEISPDVFERLQTFKRSGRRIIAVGTTSCRTLESAFFDPSKSVLAGETKLFITPGYAFRFVDGLITNFHLPKSTLLMLVSALIGREKALECYRLAAAEQYRFFSFGDGMLIL